MPDTFENKNGRLEDKAWMDMSDRLDKAMPVKRGFSRREWMLLIILFLVLISFGSYVALLRNDLEDKNEKNIINEEMHIASKSTTEQNALVGITDQTNIDSESNSERIDDQYSKVNESIKANKTAATSLIAIDNVTKLNQAINSPIWDDTKENVDEQSIVLGDMKQNSERKSNVQSVLDLENNTVTPNRTLRGINDLESLAGIEYFSSIPEITSQGQSIYKFRPGICRNVFSAHAAIYSENMISFGGLEMGFGHLYNLNRNLGISYGLRFQIFYKEGFRNTLALTNFSNSIAPHLQGGEFEDLSEYRYVYDVQNSEIVENEVGVEYLMGIVDKLYYLSLPVNMHFNWNRLSFFGGANASFLLRGTNQVRDYSHQYFNTVILSNHVLEKRNYYNRIDIGFQAGIEYRIWKNLSIYGRYNHGTLEILNSGSGSETNEKFVDRFAYSGLQYLADRVDYNRHFTLGLKLNLNHCR